MDTLTSTATKAVSNTKLAIATLAMLAAGGAALATVPLNNTDKWAGCVDSDNQFNNSTPFRQDQLFSKGETKYKSGSKMDYCYTFPTTQKTYLMEGTCNASKSFVTWQKNCAELNAGKPENNYQCVDGACVNTTVATSTATCTDSDGGKNYNVQGEVVFKNGPNEGYNATDSCLVENGPAMTEQYCENNIGKTENVTCPNGCKNGTCVAVAAAGKLIFSTSQPESNKLMNGTQTLGYVSLSATGENIKMDSLKFTFFVESGQYGTTTLSNLYLEDEMENIVAGPVNLTVFPNTLTAIFLPSSFALNDQSSSAKKLALKGIITGVTTGSAVGVLINPAKDVVGTGMQSGQKIYPSYVTDKLFIISTLAF